MSAPSKRALTRHTILGGVEISLELLDTSSNLIPTPWAKPLVETALGILTDAEVRFADFQTQ